MESIICRLPTSEISIFELVSVAEQAGLNLTLLETQKTGFLASRPRVYSRIRKPGGGGGGGDYRMTSILLKF